MVIIKKTSEQNAGTYPFSFFPLVGISVMNNCFETCSALSPFRCTNIALTRVLCYYKTVSSYRSFDALYGGGVVNVPASTATSPLFSSPHPHPTPQPPFKLPYDLCYFF